MALKAGEGSSLKGVSRRISGRHAFIHERVLEMVARETELRGSVTFCKNDLAHRLGCCPRTLDRAIIRLRREGLVVTAPVFGETGAQLGRVLRQRCGGLIQPFLDFDKGLIVLSQLCQQLAQVQLLTLRKFGKFAGSEFFILRLFFGMLLTVM